MAAAAAAARRARLAVSVVFFCNGAAFASWVSRIPSVRDALQLSDGELGTALFAVGAGALFSFPLAGRGIRIQGARQLTLASAALFFFALPQPLFVSVYASLLLTLFIFGAANGAMDVSMNALAVEAETAYGKPIMSSFHGLWSVGGLSGAMLGSLAAKTGMAAGTHLLLAALALGAAVLAVARWLPRRAGIETSDPAAAILTSDQRGPRRADRALVGLGCIVFCSFLIEGAMADWSAVFLRDALGASAAQAALGYAAFSLTMTAMRLAGDPLVARWGAVAMLRSFNLLSAAALLLALLAGHRGGTLLAFGLVGLGVATVAPTVFGAAARRDGQQPGRGIALMAGFGYAGFLLGPPLIGWLAQAASLRLALGVLVLLSLAIVALLPLLRAPPAVVQTAVQAAEPAALTATGWTADPVPAPTPARSASRSSSRRG